MIGWAAAQKTRATVRLLLNDAAARRDRGRSKWIGGPKHRDNGQSDGSSNVHRNRLIANKKTALGYQRRQFGDRGFPGEICRRPAQLPQDCRRAAAFGGASKAND